MRRFLAAMLLLLPVSALGQPRLVPAQDVEVLYRVSGAAAQEIPGGAPQGVRLQWDAAGQRLRTDPVGGPVYAITDLQRRVADVVFPAQAAVLVLPLRGGDPQALLAGADAQFTRRGPARVLGMDCTEWTIHSRHVDGIGCVTLDGIVLRAEGTYNGQAGGMTAISVNRGPISAGQFQAPEQFFRMPLGAK